MNRPIRFGLTDPISTSFPKEEDLALTNSLISTLKSFDFFEDEQESVKREIVLGKLNVLVHDFVKRVGIEQGMTEDMAAQSGGKIFSFGSYRLGVHSKGADIDTLCVVPQHVSRTDFFTIFYDMLAHNPAITHLTQVADAFVPVIQLEYDGIAIDLLFARLSMPSVSDNVNLLDNGILKNLDDKCIVSLNGSRTTDEILSLIPNVQTFHTALRCIKLWAKRRGLYNNSLGYIGGVACAILTARICQLYPNAAPSTIVSRFFAVYSSWKWPQPIMLKRIEYDSPHFRLNMRVWNPRTHPVDRNHRMPIITPAFPAMCSTHNVNHSTFELMNLEFLRGKTLLVDIEAGRKSWADLLERSDFFYRYKHFLQINAIAKSKDAFQLWKGFVESKIRLLVNKLESLIMLNGAPPFQDPFISEFPDAPTSELILHLIYSSSNISVTSAAPVDPDTSTKIVPSDDSLSIMATDIESSNKVFVASFYIALDIQAATDAVPGPRKLNLAAPVSEFKKLLVSWEKYKADQMEIHIADMKRSSLPTSVFEGRPRPT